MVRTLPNSCAAFFNLDSLLANNENETTLIKMVKAKKTDILINVNHIYLAHMSNVLGLSRTSVLGSGFCIIIMFLVSW